MMDDFLTALEDYTEKAQAINWNLSTAVLNEAIAEFYAAKHKLIDMYYDK
jgi:hypothetical protein